MPAPDDVISHCNKYKYCKGCPFVGAQCVAPVAEHLFENWIKNMSKLIADRNINK